MDWFERAASNRLFNFVTGFNQERIASYGLDTRNFCI